MNGLPSTNIVASLAIKHRLLLAGLSEFAEAGALIGYGVNFLDLYARVAYFVNMILEAAKPGSQSVDQLARFELPIKPKTARTFGITVPKAILLHADSVIE